MLGMIRIFGDAQVVRGDFIIFFNQIFDALCKLSADSDANVQSAAHLLDRLVKVILSRNPCFTHFISNIRLFLHYLKLSSCLTFLSYINLLHVMEQDIVTESDQFR